MPKLAPKRITNGVINNAKPEANRYEIRDSAIQGFMLRVSPSGKKFFYVQLERGKKRMIGDVQFMLLSRARFLANDMLNRYKAGEEIESTRTAKATLGSFLSDTYLPWAKQNLKNGHLNVKRLQSCCKTLLSTRVDRLTEIQIERWKSDRLKSNIKRNTVKRDLAELKAVLTRLVKWGFATSNPGKGVTVKVETDHRVRYLNDAERKQLQIALSRRDDTKRIERESANVFRLERNYEPKPELGKFSDYLTPMVLVAMHTGLRRSELFSLSWDQVKLIDTPQVAVLAAHSKAKRTRHVPLNSVAVKALTTWGSEQGREGLVFPHPKGGQLKSIKTAWGNLMKQSEIEDFRFHDLRHDFASMLVMREIDLYRVKELLGHSSIDITQRYAHLSPKSLAEAVEAIA